MTKTYHGVDPGTYDRKAHSDKYAVTIEGDSMTVQGDPAEYDLNVMMKRFGITGKMPENLRMPQYGDYTGIKDYRSAMDAIRQAKETFDSMTPEVRAYFGNDPQQLLEAHEMLPHSPELVNKFRDLGLVNALPPEVPKVDPTKTGTT